MHAGMQTQTGGYSKHPIVIRYAADWDRGAIRRRNSNLLTPRLRSMKPAVDL